MARSSNLPCRCGSGKPYKKCHRAHDIGMEKILRKAYDGELKFRAEVISESGEVSSMQAGNFTIIRNGVERVVSDDMFTLTTNTVLGDKTDSAAASMSLSVDGTEGEIATSGNATVSNQSIAIPLRLQGNVRKLKAKSPSGGFVIARIDLQRDTNTQYFDFLFGKSGQPEEADNAGRKNRSHVAFFPDGNGKFLRLAGGQCELSCEQRYLPGEKMVVPRIAKIRSPHFTEQLVAQFVTIDGTVELQSIGFTEGAA